MMIYLFPSYCDSFTLQPADGGVGVVVNVGGDNNGVNVNVGISTRDDIGSLPAAEETSALTNSNDAPSLFFEYEVDESNTTLTVDQQINITEDYSYDDDGTYEYEDGSYDYDDEFAYDDGNYDDEEFNIFEPYLNVTNAGEGNEINMTMGNMTF